MAYSKFIQLTHIDGLEGKFERTPLYVDPKDVQQIINHCVYLVGGSSFPVEEKAEVIHQMVVDKLEENKQQEIMR